MATFDRAWAKAQGYTDAEIDQYIRSSQGRADSLRAPSAAASTQAGPQPPQRSYGGLVEPALSLLPAAESIALGAAGAPAGPLGLIAGAGLGASGGEAHRQLIARALGLDSPETSGDAAERIGAEGLIGGATAGGAALAGKLAGPVLSRGGALLREVPVLGKVVKVLEALRGPGGAAAPVASAPNAVAVAEDAGRPALSLVRGGAPEAAEPEGVLVREHVRGRPAPKKPPTGTARSRIKALEREAKIAKGAPGPKATGTAQSRIKVLKARGASSPELARRTAARASAVGHAPAMEAAGSMEAMLQRSLELEQEMSAMGIPEEMKALVRAHARAGLQP